MKWNELERQMFGEVLEKMKWNEPEGQKLVR